MKTSEINKKEKPLFSEVFYRNEKKLIKKYVKIVKIELLIIFLLHSIILWLYTTSMLEGIIDLLTWCLRMLGSLMWIFLSGWMGLTALTRSLTYIVIYKTGIGIIRGNKEIKFIPKNDIQKLIINVRKKRIEIYLRNGKVIYSKRLHRREIEYYILYYDQFERFKKAMKEIGVEYEIIYA